jgi:hypothetical protein
LLLLFLSQLCICDLMFYETCFTPLSLVLFTNLNLILLVLNEEILMISIFYISFSKK